MNAQSTPAAFDAAKYITKVSGRDYLEVKWRLVWMRTDMPSSIIETELMEHANAAALFRARVQLIDADGVMHGSATGWGSEAADDFGDYLEKAETKALGRALAACGFGTQFCADYEFGADRGRVVDAPVDVRGGNGRGWQSRPPAATAGMGATPKQIQYLNAVAREAGLNTETLEFRAGESFGKPLADLDRREISALIETIQSERAVP